MQINSVQNGMSYGKVTVIALAVLINCIVAINAFLHDPFIGYDADGHLDYMATVAQQLPSEKESGEYFSPPLPYLLPGLVFQTCDQDQSTCKFQAGKIAQIINLFLSIGITILLIKISEQLSPGNYYLKISTLSLLSILTVYYKTFAQVRGEPYVGFFTAVSIWLGLRLMNDCSQKKLTRNVVYTGVALGGLALSRQWGFFLFPSFVGIAGLLLLHDWQTGKRFSIAILLSFAIAFVISSWFYFSLFLRFGSFTPFSTDKASGFSLSNQPLSFYRNLGISSFQIFRVPVRKTFDNQLIPLFYSDTWGDYWGYFTFIRGDPLYRNFVNKVEITPYLGRVNAVALLPSGIFAGSLLMGLVATYKVLKQRSDGIESLSTVMLFLMILISWMGYLWFLIKYPLPPKGATIKATYMLQIFIVLPLLGSMFLERIRAYSPKFYKTLIGLLAFALIHNLPAMITRYWWFLIR